MKRAIEDSFPIVEINRLAVPERNAFKPIYQMHKWFARRASCVFRAILLGALKPLPVDKNGNPTKSGAEVIMDEFYKDHTNDPDTNGKHILDPFMGGGTTMVEAQRLGCTAMGIDLNPVAWFIVRTEVEPVDIDELNAAYERLANREVDWSGRALRDTLLDLYKTPCPSCGGSADILYTFWVKEALCTAGNCTRQTPLYPDYVIASKTPSIRYIPDCDCPACGKVFDWEIEPAALIGSASLMVSALRHSAGHGRSNARWAYGYAEEVKREGWRGEARCPWCSETVRPRKGDAKPKRKKVDLSILLCPKCEEVWQFRGQLPEEVTCPTCSHAYDPRHGNIPGRGKFLCKCGNVAAVIESCRRPGQGEPLPVRPYAVQAICGRCARTPRAARESLHADLFDDNLTAPDEAHARNVATGVSHLWKNQGRFFARVTPQMIEQYQGAEELWIKNRSSLPYPRSKVPWGEKTKTHLIGHNYIYWHQMYNPRQLLCLSTTLAAIQREQQQPLRELLLCAFSASLARNNMHCYYWNGRNTVMSNFDRHDYAPKLTAAENSYFQSSAIRGTFPNMFSRVVEGKKYCTSVYDNDRSTPNARTRLSRETTYSGEATVLCADSRGALEGMGELFDLCITDPPYAGNVSYSELSDFFYVWLRLALGASCPAFAPEYVSKEAEIVENRTRGKSRDDFKAGLSAVFSKARQSMNDGALLVFTFHHAKAETWAAVLEALVDAGFCLLAAYPIHGEKESSLNLMDTTAISYDLIHVCAVREDEMETRSWAGVRREIRRRAREEIAAIESGRYGGEPLAPVDKNIVLIGKCLELYSRHYGHIVDSNGEPVAFMAALEDIRMMIDQVTMTESELPSELAEIDAASYVYLTCLCDRKEIKSDHVSKATKGICEPSTLMERDLMIKGRAKRGRTYEVKQPLERLDVLRKKFGVGTTKAQQELFDEELDTVFVPGVVFIDYVHLLLGLVESGENVIDWLDKFRGRRPEIRAALEYMARKNRGFADPVRKIIGLMDEKTLFNREEDKNA